jgi:hypothetical protein
MTNLHQLQLCCNELEAEVGKDVMSQHAIENALQRRVEILKASLGSSTVEMLALTTSKEEQVEQFSKTMRALEAELLVMRGKGGKVDYLEQIIRGLQTEVTEERKGRMGAEQEVGHLQDNTRVLQEEHTRALQALQANTRADIVRLEQKVGASDAITRSKAEKVDQLEQKVGILQAEVAHEKRERVGAEEKVGQLSEKVRVLKEVVPAPDVGVGMALEELMEKSSTGVMSRKLLRVSGLSSTGSASFK